MRLRALGKGLPNVSELSLGTWGLSGDGYGPVTEAEQDKVLERAVALGVTLFETADAYGDGAMEKRLGERLPKNVLVATKLGTDRNSKPPQKRFTEAYLRESFEKSRERLQRDVVDIVLLHNPVAKTVETGEATAVLKDLKASGAITAWGVSAGSVDVARAALAQGAEVLSLTYHVFSSNDVRTLHDELQAKGVCVLAHSVLSHGLLSGFWSLHKEFAPEDHRNERWTPDELRRRVQQLVAVRPLVGAGVWSMRAAALRFALACPDVSSVVLGPRSALQLDQLMREGNAEPPYLSNDQLRALSARLEQAGATW
ncbi:MAG TPA: aldo/keto reductase [Polyangiaceae bacterium]|jgi:aryl-alcohol dehydrogenase-like predicted oxidoreductase|nr:aldo/keto reductase [Polyangiaceae bacterium]